jgi:signal transduction histidine kinase
MRQRIAGFCGTLTVEPGAKGTGTRVTAQLPLDRTKAVRRAPLAEITPGGSQGM